jgi:RimJ/RimL family protein N-acetyltransferase
MKPYVLFRDFEERDIDFIYKCKNDEHLNSMIVGKYKPFSYDDAVKWVHGCMGEHDTYKFWAVCTNDDERRIVGWVSISQIDYENQSVCFHGIVIGDKAYNDGFAWIESHIFVFQYCFEILKMNRVYSESLVGHRNSNNIGKIIYLMTEGIKRQAVYKNGKFYDVLFVSLLKDEYFEHKNNGDYEMKAILKRISYLRKNKEF